MTAKKPREPHKPAPHEEMDVRSKLGVGFMALVAVVAVLMTFDGLVFRPREPIYAFTDRETLERELDLVISATSRIGTWGEKRSIQRTSLVVSANFSSRSGFDQSVEKLTELLKLNGWQIHRPSPAKSLASLCKGRYRVELWPMEEGQIALSLSVKRFQREADCATQ